MAMAFAFKMMRHPKASQELQYALNVIKPTMTDPNASREEKRAMLNTMVSELTEDTFKLEPVAEQIMEIINMKEDVCQEYDDLNAQVEGILSWLPRMRGHVAMLTKEVRKHRKQYGLRV